MNRVVAEIVEIVYNILYKKDSRKEIVCKIKILPETENSSFMSFVF